LYYESDLFWQLDVNITQLQGATLQILNGTSFFYVDQGIEIGENEFKTGKRNYTYNVTFNVSELDYDTFGVTDSVRDRASASMKGTDYVTVMNQIFVTFTAIAANQSPSFMANIGLRYFNKTWEDMAF
jgi:hypothetical protein